MKTTALLFLLSLSIIANAQEPMNEKEMKQKTDSILTEGNLLFKYERSAWVSTDLAMEKSVIKKEYGGYLVYQVGDTIKTIILNKENKLCIYELSFIGNYDYPKLEVLTNRNLTAKEENLLYIKNKILGGIIEQKIAVEIPAGCSLNMDLLPTDQGYKFYILSGTSQSQMIPFGNDYLFYADLKGTILTWKKFHSRFIPTQTKGPNEEVVLQTTHSHLKKEPFISATDICTFMLYGSLYDQMDFLVYSPAFSKYFKYKLASNEIEILNEP